MGTGEDDEGVEDVKQSKIQNLKSKIEGLVEGVVRKRIIENWEGQDEPEHLKTIRDRIMKSGKQRTGRLLGLCQQIVQQGEIVADDSYDQMTLRLTGLVVRRDGKLRIYNRIYAEVSQQEWCNNLLAKLRPYSDAFNAWVASDYEDESRLLRGQALQEALAWRIGTLLSGCAAKSSTILINRLFRRTSPKSTCANSWAAHFSMMSFPSLFSQNSTHQTFRSDVKSLFDLLRKIRVTDSLVGKGLGVRFERKLHTALYMTSQF